MKKKIKKGDIKLGTLCAIPWNHLNFEPNGKVIPCCLTSTFEYFLGDLYEDSIEEIWNSERQKKLRVQMMEGKEPEICVKCFSREKVTGESNRVYVNQESFGKKTLKDIPSMTYTDGSVDRIELKYWDFRFSNLCNLKCRTCGPRYSSNWVEDAKKMGGYEYELKGVWARDNKKVFNIDTINDISKLDFVEENINIVEKIYFAGGEPLIMPEHWYILDLLEKYERFDCQMHYNTNASTFIWQGKDAIDYWNKWEKNKVEVWPSIDEIGKRAELVRSGTIWSKVDKNLRRLTESDNITVRPAITVGALNIFRVTEIIDYFLEIEIINENGNWNNFFLNLVEWPEHYHVSVLSNDLKDDTINKIENYIERYKNRYNQDVSSAFTHILHELKKPHDRRMAKQFLNFSGRLDRIRNENIFETIPELIHLREMYPGYYEDETKYVGR